VGKIKLSVNSRGEAVARAQVQTAQGLRNVVARSEGKEKLGVSGQWAWGQVVLDLMSKRGSVQDGASKPGSEI